MSAQTDRLKAVVDVHRAAAQMATVEAETAQAMLDMLIAAEQAEEARLAAVAADAAAEAAAETATPEPEPAAEPEQAPPADDEHVAPGSSLFSDPNATAPAPVALDAQPVALPGQLTAAPGPVQRSPEELLAAEGTA